MTQNNGTSASPPNPALLAAARLTLNAIGQFTSRLDWLRRRGTDPRRSINDECGFPENPTADYYKVLYDRESTAARVVELLPKESWQVTPNIYEDEDPEVETELEKAWKELPKSLSPVKSWYKQEEGSTVWEWLKRADIISGIGCYGVILLGLDDGLPLSSPAKGTLEVNSIPRGKTSDGKLAASLTFNECAATPYQLAFNARNKRRLLYLRVFPESQAAITQYEMNRTSPRYGQPVMYSVTFGDADNPNQSGAGQPMSTESVHWTRIVHIADTHHTADGSEVFAVPRLQPVLNNVLSLQKLYGGSAEMYWKGAFPGLALETPESIAGNMDLDIEGTRDQLEQLMNGLQRILILEGLTVKQLSPAVVDPTPQINVQESAICIKLGCPVRIFKGSERGELASSQDDGAWNDRLRERQNTYLTPRVIVPFVDRLIALGVLPEPGEDGYCVWWPDLESQTDLEKADVATKLTQAIVSFASGGGLSMMTQSDFFTLVCKLSDEEAASVIENLRAELEESSDDGDESMPSPLLGLVGGITGMIELFKLAKEGGLSEEQLKQQIMLFFKVSEEQASDILADGLTPAAAEAGDPPEPEPPMLPGSLPGDDTASVGKPANPFGNSPTDNHGTHDQKTHGRRGGKAAASKGDAGGASGGASASGATSFKGADDAHSWGSKHFDSWAGGLSKDEYKAVGNYVNSEYREINGGLRGGKGKGKLSDAMKERVKHMDSALAKASTPEAITVHRGLGADVVSKMKAGKTFTDHGYSSTSLNPSVGENYGTASMEIHVPKGSKGAYATAIMKSKSPGNEQEFLLPRGSKFKVKEVTTKNGKPHVVVEVVPS